MSSFVAPGASNVVIPSWEASGKLQVELVRNQKAFPINRYLNIRPTQLMVGRYLRLDPDVPSRLLNADDRDHLWPLMADRPKGYFNPALFRYDNFNCERRDYPFIIGSETVQQSPWDVIAAQSRIAVHQMMTARTSKVLSVLTDSSQWGANTDTATNLGGGKWDSSHNTSGNTYIMNTLLAAKQAVNKSSNGLLQEGSLQLVVSPGLAAKMAETDEIRNYVKGSPDAYRFMTGDQSLVDNWQLPARYCGINIVVENTVQNTADMGLTASRSHVLGDTTAILMSKPEGFDTGGDSEAPIFATATLFTFEDITIRHWIDDKERRHEGDVVTNYGVAMTATATGFLITACQ